MEVTSGFKKTEVGVIPDDWEAVDYVTFGQIIDGDRGAEYPGAGDLLNSGYCLFLNAGNVTKDGFRFLECQFITADKDQKLHKGKVTRGDVILTTRGTIGNFAYFDKNVPYENVRINSGMVILRNESLNIFDEYQYLVLRSHIVSSQIARLSFGSAQPQLTVKGISTLKIPIPPTKAEQQVIAQVIRDVDAFIKCIEQVLAKKDKIKQGAMQALLTGRRRLPRFRGKWQIKPFGEAARPRTERIDPRHSAPHQFCIELEHIESGSGNLVGYTETSIGSSLKSVFRKDDVLFGKLRAYLRKYWLADREGVCSAEIWVLVAERSLIIPQFLFQLVKTDRFIERASSAYGTHMPRTDWNLVKNYEISLPDIFEQTAIASILADMDSDIAVLKAKLAKVQQRCWTACSRHGPDGARRVRSLCLLCKARPKRCIGQIRAALNFPTV